MLLQKSLHHIKIRSHVLYLSRKGPLGLSWNNLETEEWDNTYKIRTVVKSDINHIKENLCLAGRRTQNEKTLHADLILASITPLITVVPADKINHHEYIRSLKQLVASNLPTP